MRGMKIEITTELVTITCCVSTCGILFAVPERWDTARRESHAEFYCPNGHNQAYLSKTQAEKLQAKLKDTERERDWERNRRRAVEQDAMTLANQRRALRGVVTKLKRKAAAGECGFCHRQFADVAEHVVAEHPGVSVEAEDADESEPAS